MSFFASSVWITKLCDRFGCFANNRLLWFSFVRHFGSTLRFTILFIVFSIYNIKNVSSNWPLSCAFFLFGLFSFFISSIVAWVYFQKLLFNYAFQLSMCVCVTHTVCECFVKSDVPDWHFSIFNWLFTCVQRHMRKKWTRKNLANVKERVQESSAEQKNGPYKKCTRAKKKRTNEWRKYSHDSSLRYAHKKAEYKNFSLRNVVYLLILVTACFIF